MKHPNGFAVGDHQIIGQRDVLLALLGRPRVDHFLETAWTKIWGVPQMGVPQNHPNFHGIFHNKNHPAIGDPPFMEIPIWKRGLGRNLG